MRANKEKKSSSTANKEAEISVDEIAEMLGTISYEVLSVLSRRIPAFISETAKSLKYQLRYYTYRRHSSRIYV